MTNPSFLTAFIIGLVASISSCVAMVGGLVLSVSANFAKSGDNFRPQLFFHVGRLVSFFLFGGVIGLVGASFQLSDTGAFIVGLVVSLVMIILGLNLLEIFPWANRLQLVLPGSIRDKIHNLKYLNHTFTPLIIGALTFFLPCGFTQSMQIYALSSGSFWAGAFTMFAFALGTLPVLALLSFGSLGIHKKAWSGIFLKIAGGIVIVFGFFSLLNSLSLINIRLPNLIPVKEEKMTESGNVKIVGGLQVITLEAGAGYAPEQSVAQAGIPTVIRFETKGTFDCSAFVRIPTLNINKYLPQNGSMDIDIGTQSVGTFRGSCGMGMYPFEILFK